MPALLITDTRIVPFRSRSALARLRAAGAGAPPRPPSSASPEPVDVRLRDGVVVEIGPGLACQGDEVLEADGGFLIPGLWDAHAHLDLEAARAGRLDTAATRSAKEALEIVARALRELPATGPRTIQGFGHRLSAWPRVPTIAELDEVTGEVPTVLISGDVHSGWVNSAALRILSLPGAGPAAPGEPMREDPWFALLDRLDEIPGTRELREAGYRRVLERAVADGITGVVDMSWAPDPQDWPRRLHALAAEASLVTPRIRSAVYREGLGRRIEAGLRTGDPLPGSPLAGDGQPLLTQGPLKVIADGSMGTASAHMRDPYPAALGLEHPCGVANISRQELTELMARAHRAGFETAIHAIGDAAVDDVAAAFAASGAAGRLEHAQLLPADAALPGGALARLVDHGVELSVQPAHLIDDWAAVGRVWPGLEGRTYAFADMVRAGALLHLGSDAPVAPLDPWLAMSAAVGRATPDGRVWSPEQRLSAEEALAASVDGAGAVAVGSAGDLALVECDPLLLDAEELAGLRPVATVVAGAVHRR
ncbi:MAG: amidohydrolase family protein [Actinomyces sp.]|uniref:amidohydrolase n=1 Tax=Actinomyces sp. TaxID=29317 RepID=UPI0026DB6EFD|nr:amidohydrolase family protein [Actinomyces sp.]MDO4243255.1 amidohydrolase family protein [Actinomyces sp.]